MIGHLTGKLIAKTPPTLMVDVGGVGYELEAPMSTFYTLPAVGQQVSLHTHLVVREDAQLLLGFASIAEKNLFRELIRISGVGPKLALTVLSGASVDEFWNAVRALDASSLTRLPGIGKKTAERLLMEMKDRAAPATTVVSAGATTGSALQEARAALAALGYKPAEVQKLTESVQHERMTTEQIIQEALKKAAR
ncbi:MAG TPA: Holliday junction branch migration protein RuvA [Nevskiaceae bacterium]|nr:Holliday junction branch migration protein RuvA [Nevskiaceae bacterium]